MLKIGDGTSEDNPIPNLLTLEYCIKQEPVHELSWSRSESKTKT